MKLTMMPPGTNKKEVTKTKIPIVKAYGGYATSAVRAYTKNIRTLFQNLDLIKF